jgi:hypothetical protein
MCVLKTGGEKGLKMYDAYVLDIRAVGARTHDWEAGKRIGVCTLSPLDKLTLMGYMPWKW